MIAIWDNGRDCSDHALHFIDLGAESENRRVISHIVGLMRCFGGYGNDRQRVIAMSSDMVLVDPTMARSFTSWIRDLFVNGFECDDDKLEEAVRICNALPDWALDACDIWHYDGLGPRIAHRRVR